MSTPDPKKVARKFLTQQGGDWTELYMSPYPRGLTRQLPTELDVVWWRAGSLRDGDIHEFIKPTETEDNINNDASYQVGSGQRVRADKVYLR